MNNRDYKTRDRIARYRLAAHAELSLALQAAGADHKQASRIAYREVCKESNASVLRKDRAQYR